MSSIEEILKKNRPNLSPKSIKAYTSTLKNIYQKVYPDDNKIVYKKYENYDDFIKVLKDVPNNKRKSILSALVVFCGEDKCKRYRDLMIDDAKDYNEEQQKQEKNKTQEDNWITFEEIEKIFKQYFIAFKHLIKKDNLTDSDYQIIQNFIIISLLSGLYIAPRRALDFTDFKIKNINKEIDNFLEKNKFIFNSYKTAKFYGRQEVEIPTELKKIISKWIKINPTEYLLFDVNKEKLSNVKLNQRLNKIFGKKISVNMLRHIYLSSKYSNMIKQNNELKNDLKDMGTSMIQAPVYIKK
jgi:integrase